MILYKRIENVQTCQKCFSLNHQWLVGV